MWSRNKSLCDFFFEKITVVSYTTKCRSTQSLLSEISGYGRTGTSVCRGIDLCGRGPITRRSFPREAFSREDAQGYVFARQSQRAETYPFASSRGNGSRGKNRRIIGPKHSCYHVCGGVDQSEYVVRSFEQLQSVQPAPCTRRHVRAEY